MGTRGAYGFRKNGEDKVTYNHFDSYPDGLGSSVMQFAAENSIADMNTIFDKVVLVSQEDKPTPEQIEACKEFTNLGVSEQK